MKEKAAKKRKTATLPAQDVSIFCAQVAMILKAAIPLAEGVEAIGETLESARAQELIAAISHDLGEGKPFYTALANTGAFPRYMIGMVEIGAKSGRMDEVLEALAEHYEREAQLRKSVKNAVLYPIILVVMMGVVISVLVAKVMPVFEQVFRDLGSEMNATSAAMMNIGMQVGQYAVIIVGVLALAAAVCGIVAHFRKGFLEGFLSRFGPMRRLAEKIASARFASVMAMMLASGYDADEALEMIPAVLPGGPAAQKVRLCREKVGQGVPFGLAMRESGLFPGIYGRMVGMGVRAGSLDSVMQKLAGIYEEEAEDSIDRAVSLIEPALVAVLSVVIGAILLSVILPLMSIMTSIG